MFSPQETSQGSRNCRNMSWCFTGEHPKVSSIDDSVKLKGGLSFWKSLFLYLGPQFDAVPLALSMCNRMGPRAIKDSFHKYFQNFHKIWKTLKKKVNKSLITQRHLWLLVYHIKGKIIKGFVDLWYFIAFKLLVFSSCLCPLLENFSPVVRLNSSPIESKHMNANTWQGKRLWPPLRS